MRFVLQIVSIIIDYRNSLYLKFLSFKEPDQFVLADPSDLLINHIKMMTSIIDKKSKNFKKMPPVRNYLATIPTRSDLTIDIGISIYIDVSESNPIIRLWRDVLNRHEVNLRSLPRKIAI